MLTAGLFLASCVVACVVLVAMLLAVDANDGERLCSSPLPAKVCPNCNGYYVGVRCESCRWTEEPVIVTDDDSDDDEDTGLYCPAEDEPTLPGTHC